MKHKYLINEVVIIKFSGIPELIGKKGIVISQMPGLSYILELENKETYSASEIFLEKGQMAE